MTYPYDAPIVWPIPTLAIVTHAISIVFALGINRFFKAPSWLVASLSYNKSVHFVFPKYFAGEDFDRGSVCFV